MYLKSIKACCALAFVTILAIHSEISEEQCLNRIPTWLEVEYFSSDMEVTTQVPR